LDLCPRVARGGDRREIKIELNIPGSRLFHERY
jgi:hypothetical protein